jgi:UDPglucose 6-dehydrogenase
VKVCVLGLWHLGSVTAAGLAALGHRVVGVDFDPAPVAGLSKGIAPVFEPGLEELLGRGLASGNLRFSCGMDAAANDVEVLWVTVDTPVDDDDRAHPDFVIAQIERALARMNADAVVLVSSQLPVGSIRRLERAASDSQPSPQFAYCPENLRLGTAVKDFLNPDRMVVGVRSARVRERLAELLRPIAPAIEWMSVESAEMTKHAINAFLAASVSFANEIAALCEVVGADAKEVERGLKSERRIGPGAYVSQGGAFSGGTLARDVGFLTVTARERDIQTPLLSAILPSNDLHKHWVENRLRGLFSDLSRTSVAIWGLAYKPGTDTLRRSSSVELCDWLIRSGASVRVHDPMVRVLPEHWDGAVTRCADPVAAAVGAHALVIATRWPVYSAIPAAQLAACRDDLVVLDADRFVPALAAAKEHFRYFAVGVPGGES